MCKMHITIGLISFLLPCRNSLIINDREIFFELVIKTERKKAPKIFSKCVCVFKFTIKRLHGTSN